MKTKQREISEINKREVLEVYLNLANTIHKSGGLIDLILHYIDEPLSKFIEEVCASNDIRFTTHKRD